MNKPTVAIVGRPNVGKSTLFNRLVGGRPAIVSEEAGTTRDRQFGDAQWAGRSFWVVDTGGLIPDSDEPMDRAIRRQVDLAIEQADLLLFVVDGKAGLHPLDESIAARLRQTRRPVMLVVNKLDGFPNDQPDPEFYRLGLGDLIPVSAAVGKSSGDLLDEVLRQLPEAPDAEDQDEIRVAIVGRPNVGKSSLANRLVGAERHVVAATPGTTRDAIDSVLTYHGQSIRLIDTAGLRRKSRVEDDVEFYSTVRTSRAMDQADVAILVVDAVVGLHHQDLRIATDAWDRGAGLIVVVNKWDLIPEKDSNTGARGHAMLAARAPFLADVPFLYTSAATGQRVRKILDSVIAVAAARKKRIPTAEVNRVLSALVERAQPPQKEGEEVKLLYASQVATEPPVLVIMSNRPDDLAAHYQRYLLSGFREAWGFEGVPIRLKLKARHRTAR